MLASLLALAAAPVLASEAPPLAHRFYLSPAEIRAQDPRALARALVEKIRRECDEAGPDVGAERPLGAGFEIVMMVPARALGSIARHGLRNQHETATSGGFHRTKDRFETEQQLAMTRLPYGARGRALLPKYAVLNVRGDGLGTYRLPARYGEAAVVLKPEIAERATWTYADSLDFSRQTGLYLRGGAGNPVLPRTAAYRRRPGDENRCGNYCEAQVWGPLSWEDVDYVMIPDTAAVPSALLNSGTSVYRYRVLDAAPASPTQTALFVRGGRVDVDSTTASVAASDGPGPAEAALLSGEARARLSDSALAAEIEASTGPERPGLIGELAERPKSAAAVAELKALLHSSDPTERELALYGLSELPKGELKPFLIAGLRDASPRVEIEAVALAAERRGDPDVALALTALKDAVARGLRVPSEAADWRPVAEWLGRLDAARFCR